MNMTTQIDISERRGQSYQLIDELMTLRTEMLAQYSMLGSARPFEKDDETITAIQDFCQALVDYTADAHFSLYRFISEGKERRAQVLDVANRVYPKISETTGIIIAFNDKYDDQKHCEESLGMLEKDLSYIGEVLADRIENEDSLIRVLRSERK